MAFDTFFTSKLSMLLQKCRLRLRGLQATLMDTLITHLTLMVWSLMVSWQLALLASPTEQAVPDKALDQVSMQVHTFTVDYHVTFCALQ